MKVRLVGDRYDFYTFCRVQALISFDSGCIFEDACRITCCKTEAGNSSEQRADYLLATIKQVNPWKGQIRFYAAYYKDGGFPSLGFPGGHANRCPETAKGLCVSISEVNNANLLESLKLWQAYF